MVTCVSTVLYVFIWCFVSHIFQQFREMLKRNSFYTIDKEAGGLFQQSCNFGVFHLLQKAREKTLSL